MAEPPPAVSSSCVSCEPGFAEAREYVRQELTAMGARILSQHELDMYTREFLRLVSDRESVPGTANTSNCTDTTSDDVGSSASSNRQRSAVYKSFPAGGKENRVVELPASPALHCSSRGNDSICTTVSDSESYSGRKVMRKVLKSNMEVDITESRLGDSHYNDSSVSRRPPSAKSFIPPPCSHPHTRGLRKADPVSRYHEYRELWERQQAPGEKNRMALRWQIREQLLQQAPPPPPPQPARQPNNYIVPSTKRRQSLRWKIRTNLAQHTQ